MTDKKTLVVVESPTKAKTIKRYLGKEYEVTSSMGHLIDLPKSRLAVDIKNGFEPDYITIRGRGKILKDLKRDASRSKQVYLAADSDREGEAISFHIGNAIKKDKPQLEVKRIVFNEITEDAIKEAVRHPREIDTALVNAQKARRVLDRLVGYNLSPLLWEKIKKGLSAGRVQSVALKVICEREAEIDRFVPSGYWTIEAVFVKGKKTFTAKLVQFDGKKAEITTEQAAEEIYQRVKNGPFVVIKIEEKERKRRPQAPFTTSKLQQAAG
jgi:DNA topoisomerase-1